MKTNQHIIKSSLLTIMLVMGFILAPIFAFGQQTEPTKTVNVVVTLKAKSPEKEIIQLPADNQPKVVHGIRHYALKKTKSAVATTTKTTKPTIAPTTTAKLKPVTAAKPVQQKAAPIVAVLKPTPKPTTPIKTVALKPQPKPTQTVAIKPTSLKPVQVKPAPVKQTAQVAPTNSLKPNAVSTKQSTVVSAKATKAMVATERAKVTAEDSVDNPNANNTNIQASNSDKQNTISYVWIGVILIIAGVILGLLFGRTAFLVSFVGVIFILLGVFIF